MHKKHLLSLVMILALMSFPAAAFAGDPTPQSQESGSDLQSTLTVTPANSVIHSGDTVTFNLHIENLGPDDAFWASDTGMPVGEFVMPGEMALDTNTLVGPSGTQCEGGPIESISAPAVAEAFPGYMIYLCGLTNTQDLTLHMGESFDFTIQGTAAADIPEETTFIGVSISDNDPDFADIYASFQDNINAFELFKDRNIVSIIDYSDSIIADSAVDGELDNDDQIVQANDNLTETVHIKNNGPAVSEIHNGDFIGQALMPDSLEIDTVNVSDDRMSCTQLVIHDVAPDSWTDVSYPGYKALMCTANDDITLQANSEITLEINMTASADLQSGIEFPIGAGFGNDPDLEVIGEAYSTNQNPYTTGTNNGKILEYHFTTQTPAPTTQPSGNAATVLGDQETNTSSGSGPLPTTGSSSLYLMRNAVVMLFLGGLLLLGCVVSRRKKNNLSS